MRVIRKWGIGWPWERKLSDHEMGMEWWSWDGTITFGYSWYIYNIAIYKHNIPPLVEKIRSRGRSEGVKLKLKESRNVAEKHGRNKTKSGRSKIQTIYNIYIMAIHSLHVHSCLYLYWINLCFTFHIAQKFKSEFRLGSRINCLHWY